MYLFICIRTFMYLYVNTCIKMILMVSGHSLVSCHLLCLLSVYHVYRHSAFSILFSRSEDVSKHPDQRAGTFVNSGPGGKVCQQMARYAIPTNKLYQKYMKKKKKHSLGPHNVGKRTFLGERIALHIRFEIFVHMFLALSENFRTTFQLKNMKTCIEQYTLCSYTNATCL